MKTYFVFLVIVCSVQANHPSFGLDLNQYSWLYYGHYNHRFNVPREVPNENVNESCLVKIVC